MASYPAPTSNAPQDIATAIYGPYFIGFGVNLLLYGILLHVFLVYWSTEAYERDSPFTKAVMWCTLALCTVNAALCLTGNFRFGVEQTRDLLSLFSSSSTFATQPFWTGLTAFVVQSFLILRAGKLFFDSKIARIRYPFLAIMLSSALLALVGSILVTTCVWRYSQHQQPPFKIDVVGAVWLWSSAFVDVGISVALFLTLSSHVAGFNRKTDSMLQTLIRIGLRTAAYTAIPAFVGAIVAVAIPITNIKAVDITLALWLPLSQLYGLSIFTTLGARNEIRSEMRTNNVVSPPTVPNFSSITDN